MYPQFNNKYNNNKLLGQYQQFASTNVPFMQNKMLMENPMYMGSIRDPNFYNRINVAKMESMKNIKSIDVEGSSVEDAINKALKKLGVPRDQIDVKILCEETKGLFGMEGAKPAKIKVSIKK